MKLIMIEGTLSIQAGEFVTDQPGDMFKMPRRLSYNFV